MALRQPQFAAVIKITRENWAFVQEHILDKDFLDADAAEKFFKDNQNSLMRRVDNPKQPFVIDNKKTRVYMWEDPDAAGETDHMVAVYGDIAIDQDKNIDITPSALIRGNNASFVFLYRMSCCSGFSALVAMNVKGQSYMKNIDSLSGTHAGQTRIFDGKVYRADNDTMTGAMKHAYMHIKGTKHDCDSHQRFDKSGLRLG